MVTALQLPWPPKDWPALPSIGSRGVRTRVLAALSPQRCAGYPVSGARCYIVDAAMQLCPVGVPGELLIGGPVLARGYHQRAELTAEKFVDNPFVEDGVEGVDDLRCYHSGDLCRFLPSGEIEYINRISGM